MPGGDRMDCDARHSVIFGHCPLQLPLSPMMLLASGGTAGRYGVIISIRAASLARTDAV